MRINQDYKCYINTSKKNTAINSKAFMLLNDCSKLDFVSQHERSHFTKLVALSFRKISETLKEFQLQYIVTQILYITLRLVAVYNIWSHTEVQYSKPLKYSITQVQCQGINSTFSQPTPTAHERQRSINFTSWQQDYFHQLVISQQPIFHFKQFPIYLYIFRQTETKKVNGFLHNKKQFKPKSDIQGKAFPRAPSS